MQDESTIFLVSIYPLLYLLTVPIVIFYLLKGIRRAFGILRKRANFLRAYGIIIYPITTSVFYVYYEVVKDLGGCG